MSWGSKKRGGSGWGSGSEERESLARFILGGIQEFVRGGVLRYGKTTPGSTSRGFWLGVDEADGLPKFHFGKSDSGVFFDGEDTTFTGDGSGVTNINGGNIQTGTVTADQINVENLEAVSVNTGDLTVTGTLTMSEVAALLQGVVSDVQQWRLHPGGIDFVQPDEDQNYIRFVLLNDFRIGSLGARYHADDDQVSGRFNVSASDVDLGSSDLVVSADGYQDGMPTFATLYLLAPIDVVPSVMLSVGSQDADAVADFKIYHYTYAVTGSPAPAAGFGVNLRLMAEDATVASQDLGAIKAVWDVATHASRAASVELQAADSTGLRTGVTVKATGSAVQVGFLGATPAARQAHIADPSGGGTVDTQARSAINSILAALETFGLVATS